MEHEPIPNISTLVEEGGLYTGDYAAKCEYCGRWISGNENTAIHLTEQETYYLGLEQE